VRVGAFLFMHTPQTDSLCCSLLHQILFLKIFWSIYAEISSVFVSLVQDEIVGSEVVEVRVTALESAYFLLVPE